MSLDAENSLFRGRHKREQLDDILFEVTKYAPNNSLMIASYQSETHRCFQSGWTPCDTSRWINRSNPLTVQEQADVWPRRFLSVSMSWEEIPKSMGVIFT